jgi:hypothetical protein
VSALITFLDVAAENSGPTVANVMEGPPLLGREHVAPHRQEVFLASAEDIGHLGPI